MTRKQCAAASAHRSGPDSKPFTTEFRWIGIPQDITPAPDRLDMVHTARRLAEFLAQLADEHVDDLELGLIHAAIEMVEKHLLGQGRALAQAEQFEHLVFLAR